MCGAARVLFLICPAHLVLGRVVAALNLNAEVPATSEELKLSWRSIVQAETDQVEMFAELLSAHNDISFQDMLSVSRAFAKHLQIEVEKTPLVNDIILGHAARHVIVHSGAVVDRKMINQIKGALPRTLKEALVEGERIRFSPEEVSSLCYEHDEPSEQIDRHSCGSSRAVGGAEEIR